MGVQAVAVKTPFEAPLTRLESYPAFEGRATPSSSAGTYVISPNDNAAFRAVNRLVAAGISVARVPSGGGASNSGGGGASAPRNGSFIVTIKDAAQARQLTAALRDSGVDAERADRLPRIAMPLVRASRIGLYKSWVANMDEGWTRWLFEQYGFPYTTLTDADVRQGGLHERFDVIVQPDQAPRRITAGHQPSDRPTVGPWGPVPPEYQGGIGDAGVRALKAFVESGGRLVTFDGASDLPLQSFGGPFAGIRNVISALPRTVFYCPGSVVRLSVDTAHPLAAGMTAAPAAYFANSRAFETDEPTVVSVARYAAEPGEVLMSGWLLGADRLAGRHAVLSVPFGEGDVVLFAFRPQFRAQPHVTFKLVFNAMFR
jgi:hypothetical protein